MRGKKAGITVLILGKTDFKTNTIMSDKEDYYIIIKGSIPKQNIILVNIYVCNIAAPKYVKQILINIKGEINSNTVILGDFKNPF